MPATRVDFVHMRRGPVRLVAAREFAEAAGWLGVLDASGLDTLLARGGGRPGRAATAVVSLPGRSERLHLRPVRHGGLLARVWGAASLGTARPLRELEALAQLRAAGAPVPAPALTVARRRFGPLWTAALGTLHEEDTVDGLAFLGARPAAARVLAAAGAAGAAVRRFHDLGGRHADLHLENLLLREGDRGVEALLVDLDRSRVSPKTSPRRRMAELMRLYRSLRKRGLAEVVGPRGCARFFSAYVAGDRALRRSLLAHLRRERWHVAVHALCYRDSRRTPRPGRS